MSRFVFAFALLILGSQLSIVHAEAIAKVVALNGSPTASGRTLSPGSDIQEHDKISVGSGNVQLIFNDGTKLVVGPGSLLVIEKYLMKGGNTASNVSVDALRGTFRFITGNSAKKAYHIKTANSTIGIRGTGFDFWVAKDTGVVVLEGKVKLSRGGSSVDINAGCQAAIAEASNAHIIKSNTQALAIRLHLPFILNQSQLKSAFRLNTSACNSVLSSEDVPGGNQGHSCHQTCQQSCSITVGAGQNCSTSCSCQ
jgi:hypothetical protein